MSDRHVKTLALLTLVAAGWPVATASATEIFWSENVTDAVFAATLPSGSGQRVVRDLDSSVSGDLNYTIAGLDLYNGFLYYTDTTTDRIFRSNVAGTSNSTLIALDTALSNADWSPRDVKANDDYLFWNDSGTNAIYRANVNGSGAQQIVDFSAGNPVAQGLEVRDNFLYWTNTADDTIYRSDLNGNNITPLIGLDAALGNANYLPGWITATSQYLFWCDSDLDMIYRANRDGTGATPLINTLSLGDGGATDGPIGLVTDGSRLYWTFVFGDGIWTSDLNGAGVELLFTPTNGESSLNVNRLAIDYVPEPATVVFLALGCMGMFVRRRKVGGKGISF